MYFLEPLLCTFYLTNTRLTQSALLTFESTLNILHAL